MTNDEIKDYFEKYFGESSNPVSIPKDSAFDYAHLFAKLSLAYRFESPDLFYDDQGKGIVYIFEHFEYDSSEHRRKKGSTGMAKMHKALNLLNESVAEFASSGREVSCNLDLWAETSTKFLCDSLQASFEKHARKIPDYKANILATEHANPEDRKFFVTFIIEDASAIGSVDQNGKLIYPFFIREFMEFFRNQQRVDCLICSNSFGKKRGTWALAKEDASNKTIKQLERNRKEITLRNIYPREPISVPINGSTIARFIPEGEGDD